MGRLTGKVAVVTGASKGIGAGIAKALAAEGAAVAVNYAGSREGAERVVAEIEGDGGRAIAVQGDVAKAADVERVFATTKQSLGTADILVNNAGVYGFAPLDELDEAEFHREFNTNVLGLLLATREAARQFGDKSGSVINIGSLVTRITPPTTAVYSGTKGAVDTITQVLAKELGPRGIRVNAINPGVVDTEGARTAGVIDGDFAAQAVAQTPLGRIGTPADIAPLAVFLASPESGWVTGEIIQAAGGMG